MSNLDWNRFRIKNENQTRALENLSYHLFCRKNNLIEGVRANFNRVGLETEPVFVKGEYQGFQAKFFDYSKKNIHHNWNKTTLYRIQLRRDSWIEN